MEKNLKQKLERDISALPAKLKLKYFIWLIFRRDKFYKVSEWYLKGMALKPAIERVIKDSSGTN